MGSFFSHASAEEVTEGLDLSSKTVLVTGVATGLGFETMRVLSLRGATVLATARTKERAAEACAKITHGHGKLIPIACDLANPQSVIACTQEVKGMQVKLSSIMCNAGIMALPQYTEVHGYEAQFMTNHVGHFILVTNLLDCLTEDGRVVLTSSEGHRMSPKHPFLGIDPLGEDPKAPSVKSTYYPVSSYGRSKLSNILFANELARRFKEKGSRQTANSLHPGVIATELTRDMLYHSSILQHVYDGVGAVFLKTVGQGAATQVLLAVSPKVEGISGEYFSDLHVAKASGKAHSEELGKELWKLSEAIVANLDLAKNDAAAKANL